MGANTLEKDDITRTVNSVEKRVTTLEKELLSTNRELFTSRSSMSRQALINGNFDIWQRATTGTNIGHRAFVADRWGSLINLDGGTPPSNIIHSRQEVQNNIESAFYFYRVNADGVGSGYGSNSYYVLSQRIEYGTRYLCGSGNKLTISFYAKSSISNRKIGVMVGQEYGTGGSPSPRGDISGTTFDLTSDWQKYTFVFETQSISSKTFGTDNNDFFEIGFCYMWGSSFASSHFDNYSSAQNWASGNIDIAQVQVNSGERAFSFQPALFAVELEDCQRYFQKSFPYNVIPVVGISRGVWGDYVPYYVGASSIFGICRIPLVKDVRSALNNTATFYRTVDIASPDNQACVYDYWNGWKAMNTTSKASDYSHYSDKTLLIASTGTHTSWGFTPAVGKVLPFAVNWTLQSEL